MPNARDVRFSRRRPSHHATNTAILVRISHDHVPRDISHRARQTRKSLVKAPFLSDVDKEAILGGYLMKLLRIGR